MFESVPNHYDRMNRILTFRLDERWRKQAAKRCLEENPSRVLDLCCGTGDLALHVARLSLGAANVVGLDYSPNMLKIAREKAAVLHSARVLRFVEGNATAIPFPDEHFDAVGIAFGFRNLSWRNRFCDQSLFEVLRVLRPGGRFVIVETSQPSNSLLKTGFHLYLKTAVASLGAHLSGSRGAYRYLAESAKAFYNAKEVSSMLQEAGFETVCVEALMGGVVAIHTAIKAKQVS